MDLEEAKKLVAKVLTKTIDASNPDANKLEFGIVEKGPNDSIRFRRIGGEEINKLMNDALPEEMRQ